MGPDFTSPSPVGLPPPPGTVQPLPDKAVERTRPVSPCGAPTGERGLAPWGSPAAAGRGCDCGLGEGSQGALGQGHSRQAPGHGGTSSGVSVGSGQLGATAGGWRADSEVRCGELGEVGSASPACDSRPLPVWDGSGPPLPAPRRAQPGPVHSSWFPSPSHPPGGWGTPHPHLLALPGSSTCPSVLASPSRGPRCVVCAGP